MSAINCQAFFFHNFLLADNFLYEVFEILPVW